ncbi:MAG: sigma-70 family RNA polymerase sigma factor [Anaerolineales bacterium]|nr:sigma-70 family RNA polymerase sigma factor [Anaerolineales bacterium]
MDTARFDDTTLLRLIARSSNEAMSELYDRYGSLVYGLALQSTGDVATAEEITQDTFLNVWKNAVSYQPDKGKVSTWLASIARHRAIDLLRRKYSRQENNLYSLEEMPSFAPPADENIENELELRARQRLVRQALNQLPKDQRQTLALAYFRGMTHAQIALALDQPLGTVKTRIRLGMQKLHQYLREELAKEDFL